MNELIGRLVCKTGINGAVAKMGEIISETPGLSQFA